MLTLFKQGADYAPHITANPTEFKKLYLQLWLFDFKSFLKVFNWLRLKVPKVSSNSDWTLNIYSDTKLNLVYMLYTY